MSTIRVIPVSNWAAHLASAIRESNDGDEIVLRNDAQKQLAVRAIARMCPGKKIKLTVKEQDAWA